MDAYIYLRCLRHVDHTVFSVAAGQKTYYDPIAGFSVAYSSGQQVKRSILDSVGTILNKKRAPVTFTFLAPNLEEKEALSLCDPQYFDQILGGWMQTAQKKDGKTKGKDTEKSEDAGKTRTLKRRSPLSISAMRPLHPQLSGLTSESMSYDRSDYPEDNKVIVRDQAGKVYDEKEIEKLLEGTDRSLLRKWLNPANRASGLFVYDIAIDLRTLFAVSTNMQEPELSEVMIAELKSKGWIESENLFGHCLIMPKEDREKIIPALAHALINWRITSNQSRTFSLMETLAVAVSNNANTLAAAIRAKLVETDDKLKIKPVIDNNLAADVFVTLPCAAYVLTSNETADALQQAEQNLIDQLLAFDYENQLNK